MPQRFSHIRCGGRVVFDAWCFMPVSAQTLVGALRTARFHAFRRTILLAACGLLAACASDAPISGTPGGDGLLLEPTSAPLRDGAVVLTQGDSTALTVRYPDGRLAQAVHFTTSAPSVARVSAQGTIVALTPGWASITGEVALATGGALMGTVNVHVDSLRITTLTMEGSNVLSLTVGETGGFRLVATGPYGTVNNPAVDWSSSNRWVATVGADGRVVAQGTGTATITAAWGSIRTTGVVNVSVGADSGLVSQVPASVLVAPEYVAVARGQIQQYRAIVRNARGTELFGHTVQWTVEPAGMATITASGLLTAKNGGEALVYATLPVASPAGSHLLGVGQLTISGPDTLVARLDVSPQRLAGVVGDSAAFTVKPMNAAGAVLSTVAVAVTGGARVGAITRGPNGQYGVTYLRAGVDTVQVSTQAAREFVVIEGLLAPVATVELTTSNAQPAVDDQFRLDAVLRDARGRLLTGRTVTYGTTTPALVRVDAQTGFATALAPGAATMTAVAEGVRSTVTVAVQPAPATRIQLTATADTLLPNDAKVMGATVFDRRGGMLSSSGVQWSSERPDLLTVTGSGSSVTLTAAPIRETRTVRIYARLDTLLASANVTITTAGASLTLLPRTLTLTKGGSAALSSLVRRPNGSDVVGARPRYVSSQANRVTVDAAGLVSAIDTGTATIVADYYGLLDSVTVQVAPVPTQLATITLSSSRTIIYLQEGDSLKTTLLTVAGRDAQGNPFPFPPGTPISWQYAGYTTSVPGITNPADVANFESTSGSLAVYGEREVVLRAQAAGTVRVKVLVEVAGVPSVREIEIYIRERRTP